MDHPALPDDVTGQELDRDVRWELSTLHELAGKEVGRHLVMAGRLLDTEPEDAYRHAAAARYLAARLPAVREAVGLAAYRTGRFAEALAELRTVRRLTGSQVHLPVMADCERGLGRPERALDLAKSPEAASLDQAGRVELLIVASGARRDLGDVAASAVMLDVPELRARTREPWLARLRAAYADALEVLGRIEEATEWLELAAAVDDDGSSGAAERLDELQDLVFLDLEEDDDEAEDEDEVDAEADAEQSDAAGHELDEDDEEPVVKGPEAPAGRSTAMTVEFSATDD